MKRALSPGDKMKGGARRWVRSKGFYRGLSYCARDARWASHLSIDFEGDELTSCSWPPGWLLSAARGVPRGSRWLTAAAVVPCSAAQHMAAHGMAWHGMTWRWHDGAVLASSPSGQEGRRETALRNVTAVNASETRRGGVRAEHRGNEGLHLRSDAPAIGRRG